jgi:hypothetical protein
VIRPIDVKEAAMKKNRSAYIVCCAVVLLVGCVVLEEAAAIVGRPITPVSYAGVARRTTRRVFAYDAAATTAVAASATAASASAAQASAASAQASASSAQASAADAQAPPAPAQPAGAPPIGTTVSSLPSGCSETTVNGIAYKNCGGVYYRTAFQGNNLVYVVVEKP